ncbi:DUF6225 family protein [Streptomyces sp. NPDC020845]
MDGRTPRDAAKDLPDDAPLYVGIASDPGNFGGATRGPAPTA